MIINADLSKGVVVDSHAMEWETTAVEGVSRKVLECDSEDRNRYTALLRFAPGARFPFHLHEVGEEFYVLEGSLSDEIGQYPTGSYVRFQMSSDHAPFSAEGCLLLVKLGQMMDPTEENSVAESNLLPWEPRPIAGLEGKMLYQNDETGEKVYLARFSPGAGVPEDIHPGGEDVFVLEGSLEDENGHYGVGTWLRFADGSSHAPHSPEGCVLWVKRGHVGQ